MNIINVLHNIENWSSTKAYLNLTPMCYGLLSQVGYKIK